MGIMQTIMRDLHTTAKRICFAVVGKSACNCTQLAVQTPMHRAKIWCEKKQRQLTADEILGTKEGTLVFREWAPATGLFKRRK